MAGDTEPVLLDLGDETEEAAGPALAEPTLGDEPESDEPTDAQLTAAKLVASAFEKGDPKLIHKALKLHYDTCQTYE
jgi:hypothetical protein